MPPESMACLVLSRHITFHLAHFLVLLDPTLIAFISKFKPLLTILNPKKIESLYRIFKTLVKKLISSSFFIWKIIRNILIILNIIHFEKKNTFNFLKALFTSLLLPSLNFLKIKWVIYWQIISHSLDRKWWIFLFIRIQHRFIIFTHSQLTKPYPFQKKWG